VLALSLVAGLALAGGGPTASASPTASDPVWSLVWADDFNGSPSTAHWGIYDGAGHAGKGIRSPRAFSATNGVLTVTGTPVGTTGGMSRHSEQRYGKWEARVKTTGCSCYHAVLILWGTPGSWPEAGEVDYLETSHRVRNTMTVHYGANDRKVQAGIAVDMTQWHTYTVEWTPDYMAGYVDGTRFFYSTDPSIQPPAQVEATIQLDWFPQEVSPTQRTGATMDVDWIRQYRLD
jgi:hypothetical protein